jgi:hypothetical protein
LKRTLQKHGLRRSLRRALDAERKRLAREAQRQQLTASEYFALRKQVRVDVESYLLEHGPDGLTSAIIEKWIGEATKACLENMVASLVDAPASPALLDLARQRIASKLGAAPTEREVEAAHAGVGRLAALVPAAPSPAYIAKHGVQELERLDIFRELHILFGDANLLRKSSIRVEKGEEKVTNARTFDRSISRRIEILGTMVSTQKELWDLQRMEAFYTAIIDTIAGEEPEVARRIQLRLAELNITIGMT